MKILGVTACPTGIAHTYMAAEAIEKAAKLKGYEVKVETRGSVGVENGLSDDDIASADLIVLACDMTVPTDRFKGKKLISIGVADAIKHASEVLDKIETANVFDGTLVQEKMKKEEEGEKKGLFGFFKK
jgi:fructose PTS system EIIBC or EIIC component